MSNTSARRFALVGTAMLLGILYIPIGLAAYRINQYVTQNGGFSAIGYITLAPLIAIVGISLVGMLKMYDEPGKAVLSLPIVWPLCLLTGLWIMVQYFQKSVNTSIVVACVVGAVILSVVGFLLADVERRTMAGR